MRTYLDHASTTTLRPVARQAITDELLATGNPSSLHFSGRRARRIVEESREAIAGALGVRPSDVVFTSGGTESNNLSIKGLYWARRASDDALRVIVVSSIEHKAVLDVVAWLVEHEGAEQVTLPVDGQGQIDPVDLAQVLTQRSGQVALVSLMWANNETGTIEPVEQFAELCREEQVPYHCDAVQGVACLNEAASWPVRADALSISAHKFGGPIGVGALVLDGVKPEALAHGGGQELGLRSGTLMVAQIAGMAAAFTQARAGHEKDGPRIRELRDDLISRITPAIDGVVVNGSSGDLALPGIANISFSGCESDALLMLLDAAGIECSAGSACTAGIPQPSHVLIAMGIPEALATASLRFSLGWDSTPEDIDSLVSALPDVVARSRAASQGRAARPRRVGLQV